MNSSTDRIERQILLKAPRSLVWQALSNAEAFGDWFGVALKGQTFTVGEAAKGHITYVGYEHLIWDVVIERMEPERLLSFRWHPYAIDPSFNYSNEPTTLVEFELKDAEGGTLLTVVESGFDGIPSSRREEAFRMNSNGWNIQIQNIEAYLAKASFKKSH
jgi:uncharacterized protein YndB with AHSA1/START domain